MALSTLALASNFDDRSIELQDYDLGEFIIENVQESQPADYCERLLIDKNTMHAPEILTDAI
jgi:hypothetical protein